MAFKFFTIPIHAAEAAEAELNGFLRSHTILSIDRRWVDQGASSFWSLCVDYLESGTSRSRSSSRAGAGRGRVDYREVLSPEDFAVYAKLRELRKESAQSEAVPVYAVFTNEQLAQMVQTKARSKGALEQVVGVGNARIEKYAPRVLEFLQQQWDGSDEAGGEAV